MIGSSVGSVRVSTVPIANAAASSVNTPFSPISVASFHPFSEPHQKRRPSSIRSSKRPTVADCGPSHAKIASAIRLSASLSHSDRCSHGTICDGLYSFVSMQYVTHASRMRWPRNSRSSGDRKGRFDSFDHAWSSRYRTSSSSSQAWRHVRPAQSFHTSSPSQSHVWPQSGHSCIMVPQFHVQRHQAAAPTILYDEFDIRNHILRRRQTLRGAFVQPSLLRWPLLLFDQLPFPTRISPPTA